MSIVVIILWVSAEARSWGASPRRDPDATPTRPRRDPDATRTAAAADAKFALKLNKLHKVKELNAKVNPPGSPAVHPGAEMRMARTLLSPPRFISSWGPDIAGAS